MSLRALANHVAEIPSWYGLILNTPELDFAAGEYQPQPITSRAELLVFLKRTLQKLESLAKANDSMLEPTWTMRSGDTIFFTEPKSKVMRDCFARWYTTVHNWVFTCDCSTYPYPAAMDPAQMICRDLHNNFGINANRLVAYQPIVFAPKIPRPGVIYIYQTSSAAKLSFTVSPARKLVLFTYAFSKCWPTNTSMA